MTIILINMAGQAVRFADVGGWKVEYGTLSITDELGVPFLVMAPGTWQGVQDEVRLRKHEAKVGLVSKPGGGNSARN